MFEIPKRASAANNRNFFEVVFGRRRRGGPFQRPGVPRIVARFLAFPETPDDVHDKQQNADDLNGDTPGGNEIPGFQAVARQIGIHAARHTKEAGEVHGNERDVEADQEDPEMQAAERSLNILPVAFGNQ